MTANSFQISLLRAALKPYRLHWFPRLRSTNDHAAVMRRRGNLFAPAVVLTGHQMAGRGRGGNSWWSQPGVLTVTFVLPVDEQFAAHQVPLLAGLAVRNAVAGFVTTAEIQLKWPNDLLSGGRKLAGLLCERMDKVDLIGLGLNINVDPAKAPAGLRDQMTSLSVLAGKPIALNGVLSQVAQQLHAMLSRRGEKPFSELLREYDSHHALVGRRVMVSGGTDNVPMSGKVEGLDGMGRLLLRDRKTLHRVIAGQVKLLS